MRGYEGMRVDVKTDPDGRGKATSMATVFGLRASRYFSLKYK